MLLTKLDMEIFKTFGYYWVTNPSEPTRLYLIVKASEMFGPNFMEIFKTFGSYLVTNPFESPGIYKCNYNSPGILPCITLFRDTEMLCLYQKASRSRLRSKNNIKLNSFQGEVSAETLELWSVKLYLRFRGKKCRIGFR